MVLEYLLYFIFDRNSFPLPLIQRGLICFTLEFMPTVLNWGSFCPPGSFGNDWRHFWRGSGTRNQWVEARDAEGFPTTHRTAPHNKDSSSTDSADIEKPRFISSSCTYACACAHARTHAPTHAHTKTHHAHACSHTCTAQVP